MAQQIIKAIATHLKTLKSNPSAATVITFVVLIGGFFFAVAGNYQTATTVLQAIFGPKWLGSVVFSPVFPLICFIVALLLMWLSGERALTRHTEAKAEEKADRSATFDAVKAMIMESNRLPIMMAECWVRTERLTAIQADIQIALKEIERYSEAFNSLRAGNEVVWHDRRRGPLTGTFDRVKPFVDAAYARGGAEQPGWAAGGDPNARLDDIEGDDHMVMFRPANNNRFFRDHADRINELAAALGPVQAFVAEERAWLEVRRAEIEASVAAHQ